MSRDTQGNILKYYRNNCLLVINSKGQIRELYTPFLVTAADSAAKVRKTFVVEEVINAPNQQLCYRINNQLFPYNQFIITINF